MTTIVARYADPIEAQIACGLLEAEGIEVHVGDAHTALANWEWRMAIGGVKLHVRDDQLAQAREVIRKLDAGEFALAPDEASEPQPAVDTARRRRWWVWLAYLALALFAILGVDVLRTH